MSIRCPFCESLTRNPERCEACDEILTRTCDYCGDYLRPSQALQWTDIVQRTACRACFDEHHAGEDIDTCTDIHPEDYQYVYRESIVDDPGA